MLVQGEQEAMAQVAEAGHLSEILPRQGSSSVNNQNCHRVAKALDVEPCDFFVFPETSERDRVIALLTASTGKRFSKLLRVLSRE
jgi:hypothetical protein